MIIVALCEKKVQHAATDIFVMKALTFPPPFNYLHFREKMCKK